MSDGSPYRRGAPTPGGPPCPGCGGALAERDTAGVASLECPGCQGRWLWAATWSELVVDPRAQERLVAALPPTPGALGPDDGLACPRCRQPMQRHPVAGPASTPVALCRAHGLWFARGQLRAAVAQIARGERVSAAETRDRAELAAALLDIETRPRRGLFDRLLGILTRRVRTLR